MRVIGGTARGRKLGTLDVPQLRPMLDRVREALFNIIRFRLDGAMVLDLFSGCGALGIEALSRGAASCCFVEAEPDLVRLLTENIARCGFTDRSRVVRADVFALSRRHPPAEAAPAALVFVDPPYAVVDDPNRRGELFRALEALAGSWIAADAVLVLHHAPMPYALWPAHRMECFDRRLYGRSQLTFFEVRKEPADAAG